MERLSLNTFIGAADDPELSQYKVLAALKIYSEMLHKNRLYPSFGDLVELITAFQQLRKQKDILDDLSPKEIKGFDFENHKLIYENKTVSDTKMKKVFDSIQWATPRITELIEEGKAIFDYVEESIKINEVGILPLYNKEGYFCVVETDENKINVFRYEMYLVGTKRDPLTTLKTEFLYQVDNEKDFRLLVDVIKFNLIEKYPDLPNPAVYRIDSDTGFPFDETILPVAKRKLIRKLAA
jgi:hypothetical protein